MTAKVALTAAGLKPEEYLFVIVQGASASTKLDPERVGPKPKQANPINKGEFSLQRLYKGRIGPSPTGDINISLAVPVTEGLYDQVWVKARIIASADAVATDTPQTTDGRREVEDNEEFEVEFGPSDVEFGQSAFPCSQETVNTACAVLLVPASPK